MTSGAIYSYEVLKTNGNDKIDNEKSKKKVIPLHKTYIWGIVFCLTALVCIVMYNIIRTPAIPSTHQDYLALVRDNHDRVADMRGITHSGGMTLGDLQDSMMREAGRTVIFPDWLGKDPSVDVIGVKSGVIEDDKVVNLLFKYEKDLVDFQTIYASRPEITELSGTTIEGQVFHIYSWGRNNAFYWELQEDNAPVTYGLISTISAENLQQMAFETMLSLKTNYESNQ